MLNASPMSRNCKRSPCSGIAREIRTSADANPGPSIVLRPRNGGRSVAGYCELQNGSRWDSAWIQLLETREYRESIRLFFDASVRSLTFPSPWLKMSPTVYERQEADGYANAVRRYRSFEEAFRRELVHFHDCCVNGVECLTPPEQARVDTELLTQMFLAA